ncbi:MAG: ribonuclease R [Proteobacteria bacterium]|nr:ribonuclease R [Pseudomonadota bacterium]
MIQPVSLSASILPPEAQIEAYVLRRLLVETCLNESELFDGLSEIKKQDLPARAVFDRLCQSGLLTRNNAGSLLIRKKARLRVGTVTDGLQKTRVVSVKDDETYFLSDRQARRVLTGDLVLVDLKQTRKRGNPEVRVLAILSTSAKSFLGQIERRGDQSVIVTEGAARSDISLVPDHLLKGGQDGQFVWAKRLTHPFFINKALAEVIRVIPGTNPAGLLFERVIEKQGYGVEWPFDLDELNVSIRRHINEAPACHGIDLRGLSFITIDGDSARDFDDAVLCQFDGERYHLDVAIADVSYWVKPGTALDQAARERGNSVYLPDRVLPMLPEILSNDVCSLRPGRERFSFVCRMTFDQDGNLQDSQFVNATIVSAARLTYQEASNYLMGVRPLSSGISDKVRRNLELLHVLAQKLTERRLNAGGVEFNFPETQTTYRGDGWLSDIKHVDRPVATLIIEECMLAANVCAAQSLQKNLPAAIYRIHGAPDSDRIFELRQVLSLFGLNINGSSDPSAGDLSKCLAEIRQASCPFETLQTLVLRCMKQASYSSDCAPHFALGFERYTHFTSPIRRYPDLIVHRLLKWIGKLDTGEDPGLSQPELEEIALHCSKTERLAEQGEREIHSILKAEFIGRHLGETFFGRVTSVTSFGLFITLDQYPIDGLLHISEIGEDFFEFEPKSLVLTGRRTGQAIRVGDPISIQVAGVDVEEGKVDFVRPFKKQKRKTKNHREGVVNKGRKIRTGS